MQCVPEREGGVYQKARTFPSLVDECWQSRSFHADEQSFGLRRVPDSRFIQFAGKGRSRRFYEER